MNSYYQFYFIQSKITVLSAKEPKYALCRYLLPLLFIYFLFLFLFSDVTLLLTPSIVALEPYLKWGFQLVNFDPSYHPYLWSLVLTRRKGCACARRLLWGGGEGRWAVGSSFTCCLGAHVLLERANSLWQTTLMKNLLVFYCQEIFINLPLFNSVLLTS